MYYKQQWANEMPGFSTQKKPDLEELIHPQPMTKAASQYLPTSLKWTPEFMKCESAMAHSNGACRRAHADLLGGRRAEKSAKQPS